MLLLLLLLCSRAPQEVVPLLDVAKQYLCFQDVEMAVYYGTRAWQIDRYHIDVRNFLKKVSPEFKILLEIEDRAISKIQRRWRWRAWRKTYMGKSEEVRPLSTPALFTQVCGCTIS